MNISVTKKDIIWSYVAQVFNIGTGLFTLPAILKLLSAEEVGFNYILISINSMICLFDLGFSSQFSRYLTYIFSGAQNIQKQGVALEYSDTINKHLLATTIITAWRIYLVISSIAFVFLVSAGTLYASYITKGFSQFENALIIWMIFCASAFFHVYYLYLNAFLQSKGLIKEAKKAMVYSRVVQLFITFALLFSDFGLISVVIANLVAPFVQRYLSYKKFYTSDIKDILNEEHVLNSEIRQTFKILLYNAKKIGVIAIFASMIGYASTLIIGVFLPLTIVASYGIMMQILGIIGNLATTVVNNKLPQFSSLIVRREYNMLQDEFGLSMFSFYSIYIVGLIGLMMCPFIFDLFNFNVTLPSLIILISFGVTRLIEQNQSCFCQLLVAENNLLYFNSSIITCIIEITLLFLLLYLGYGLNGVLAAQAIPLLSYCAWKWPIYVSKKYRISFSEQIIHHQFVKISNKIKL